MPFEPIENQHYQIIDYGEKLELNSNLYQGLIAGIKKLSDMNCNILYDTCNIIGSTYIVSAEKPTEEVKEFQAKIDELTIENRANKSLIARQKNKIDKLEKQIESLKDVGGCK